MAELQLVDYGRVKPLSLTDAIAEWQQIDANKQQQKLNEMKIAEAEQNAPLQRRLNEAQAQDYAAQAELNQQKAHMQRVQFANNIARQAFAYADKTGLKQGSLEYDQAVRQAAEPFRGAMSQAFGHADSGEPIDVNALRSLASMDVTSGAQHNKFTVHPGTGLLVDLTTGTTQEIIDPKTGERVVDPRYSTGVQGDLGQIKALTDAYKDGRISRQQFEHDVNRLQGEQIQQVESPKFKYQFNKDEDIIAMADELKKQQSGQATMPSINDVSGIPSFQQVEKEKAGIKTEASINETVGKEKEKSKFEAERDLPAIMDQANNALRLISELKTHPGKSGMVGAPNLSGALGGVRGTKEASFNTRLNQIKGQNFLQAFQNLKGAGQITEIEGQKATEAISRLDAAQEEKEFDKALDELSDIVKQGLNRAKTKAGKSDLDIHSEADAILRGSK